jgi:hypothetical protein
MTNELFPILGTTVPPMIGRAEVMRRIMSDLTKPSPNHLSIVGPRFSGKTVLLNELVGRLRAGTSPYGAIILWDLGHQTPTSDKEFMDGLRRQLAGAVSKIDADYGKHLLAAEGPAFQSMVEVLEAIGQEGAKVLMLWDGFDKPLGEGRLSRNLWDQLLELARLPSLRLVTASREKLSELARSEDSRTSDFWGVFDTNPVRLGPFDVDDLDAIFARVGERALGGDSRTELINWTGSYPPLLLSLTNAIAERKVTGAIGISEIRSAADSMREQIEVFVKYLWKDCPPTSRDLYYHILSSKGIQADQAPKSDLAALLERGFVIKSGNRAAPACKFVAQYLEGISADTSGIARMFGSPDAYRANIRSVLERRLEQLVGLDAVLKHFLKRAIDDIPEQPESCLANIRGIVDKSLELIWRAELGKEKRIPSDWFKQWKLKGESGFEKWNEQFPSRRGHQMQLLRLMTGGENSPRVAKFISRKTAVLANAAQTFGDFGQHMDGVEIDIGVAHAAVVTCVELAECLLRELKS